MRHAVSLFALVFSAAALAATAPAAPAPAATPAPTRSLQQQFDDASAAVEDGRCGEAVAALEALLARPGLAKNTQVLATIRIRRAVCLLALHRTEEASSDIAYALPLLNLDDPTNRGDIAAAHMSLGKMAYLSEDFETATREFDAARTLQSGVGQYESLMWLTRSTMFDADQRSVELADELLRLSQSIPELRKDGAASLHTLHARALLNHGQHAAAYAELKKALAAEGGLTEKVNLGDLVTRSDLALAALLNGDREQARKYMAYTGAGRFKKSPFLSAVEMRPPPCGGTAGLRPEDMAIVEFAIDDGGEVFGVTPIYASRTGPIAAEFARAVAGWSWTPEGAKSIPLFFRRVTRVELRCSDAAGHPDVAELLRTDFNSWLDDQHLQPYTASMKLAANVAQARSELARRQSTAAKLSVIPVLAALSGSRYVSWHDRGQWSQQLRDAAAAAGPPLAALTYVDVILADYLPLGRDYSHQRRQYLRSLLARPEVSADARVANIVRLLIAEPHYGSAAPADATELLTVVSTDPALSAQDPIKVGALVRLATLQAAAGNLTAARESYRKTGLSAQQCSIVDAVPSMHKNNLGSGDFPEEAWRWGFEGWVMVELDIQADGKTTNRRAVVAYPPLIFADAATGAMKNALYEQTYRPEGGLGCGGKVVKVNFKLN